LTIPQSIEQWRNKQISGLALMRTLVSHPTWYVPVSESEAAEMLATNSASRIMFNRNPDGVNSLLLYSNGDQYKGPGQHFLTTAGTWVFRLPLDGIDQIWIDPNTPHDILYDKEQFARLREMADAILLEATLLGLRQGSAPEGSLRQVRDYRNYTVAAAVVEGRPRMLMAPDNKGRTLAAIFTFDDVYDAFLPDAKAQAGAAQIQQMQLSGEALFNVIQKMSLDGIVFNCSGPVTPVAFAAAFARLVLES